MSLTKTHSSDFSAFFGKRGRGGGNLTLSTEIEFYQLANILRILTSKNKVEILPTENQT